MRIDLILKDIEDPWARENFGRIVNFISKQQVLDGAWKFFEIDIPVQSANFLFKHNLGFVPIDIIVLSAIGDQNFYFKFDSFDENNFCMCTGGPVTVRFLAGRYTSYSSSITRNYPFVANTSTGGATVAQSIRIDEVSATVTYIGVADPGAADADPVWQIFKLTATGPDLEKTFADGNSNFDNIWNNRASLTYS